MAFSSSRTLPGKSCRSSRPSASGKRCPPILSELGGQLLEKEAGEKGSIAFPFSQGRHAYPDDIDPVVEVFTKAPGSHFGLEVAVRPGHEPRVDRYTLQTAEALHLPFLYDTEKLDLKMERQFPDFIQKDSPRVGRFEKSGLACVRTRKRAFFMPEKLAFQKSLRKSAEVDGDEGAIAPRTLVYEARRHFLAVPLSPGN